VATVVNEARLSRRLHHETGIKDAPGMALG